MAERITPEKLKSLFLEIMQSDKQFTFLNGVQPFLMTFASRPYYVYIKHLSSAYFKDRPDTTRAQLPIRPDFDEIKNSSIPFVFLGYDITNDVYVCWNYHIAKTRLNEKESVSFYSRESFQKEVKRGTLLRKRLKNDDIPVFFKREDLIYFFENIENLFENDDVLGLFKMSETNTYERDGKLYKITETDLLDKIHTLVNENSNYILEAITIAKEYYGNKYPNMKYSDWSNLIKGTRQNILTSNTFKDLLNNPQVRIDIGQNSDRVVAEKYNCAINDIYRIRNQLGIKPYRKFEGGKIPKEVDKIIEDYQRLGSLQKVADEYGCSRQALSFKLKNENVDIKDIKHNDENKYSFWDSLEFKSNKEFAITIFNYLFNNNLINEKFLNFLCNKKQTDIGMKVASPYPILLKIDEDKDLKLQVFISGQTRYYTDHIYKYKNNKYVVSSQWYGPETTKPNTKGAFIKMIKRIFQINE